MSNLEINPIYRAGLQQAIASIAHEGTLEVEADSILLQATHGDTTLLVLVDPQEHTIRKAAHHSASTEMQHGLLDVLCSILVGKPIQEASDHAVITLELQLRGRYRPHPVAGIVLPRNADPMFDVPERLTRALLAQYRETTGYDEIENFYDCGPGTEWLNATGEERINRLQAVAADVCADLPLEAADITFVNIEYDVKITVDLNHELPDVDKPGIIRTLERAIKENIDGRLELSYVEMKDANVIRRLSEGRN